jgi:hypothetical protein
VVRVALQRMGAELHSDRADEVIRDIHAETQQAQTAPEVLEDHIEG